MSIKTVKKHHGLLRNQRTNKPKTNPKQKRKQIYSKMAVAPSSGDNKTCMSCGHRVPITLRDLFWQDPFFSSNWEDFHHLHDEMMAETRAIWRKFDDQLKHFEAKTPEPLPEDIKTPGWLFPR